MAGTVVGGNAVKPNFACLVCGGVFAKRRESCQHCGCTKLFEFRHSTGKYSPEGKGYVQIHFGDDECEVRP